MKIIHTSDWHIGHLFYLNNRDDEHEFFFKQLKQIVWNEKPDVLIVSGDIFHTATPYVASQKIYYKNLVDLSLMDEDLQIIIIAGNHDSPSRIEAPKLLWDAFNVYVVGTLERTGNEAEEILYDKMLIPVTRQGKKIGWVVAAPYIYQNNYPTAEGNESIDERVSLFYKNILDKRDDASLPTIATGHFYVQGSDTKGHDDSIVGGMESISAAALKTCDVDYWALGHIHHPQEVGKAKNIRYSGSPFAISFDEKYPHSIVIGEIEKGDAELRTNEIKPLIPVTDIPDKPQPYDKVLEAIHAIPDDKKVYVRVKIEVETPLTPSQNQEIQQAFSGKEARFCLIEPHFRQKEASTYRIEINSINEMKCFSPIELAHQYYKEKSECEMTDEMKTFIDNIYNKVRIEDVQE
ncbi:MAG TPA: exonuclease SbcCD subunit D C-terminal domain-containing protein [Paludibacteraceae bacterium]|nr:exonuclease SbcCD subunit D C-terminal domain-containing protein [Paludibacteraceae bacterium]HPH62516.1 exonuclease SbcCD subunit D C-terminal domain-containing protein [Paludibacteraceae bacterium]